MDTIAEQKRRASYINLDPAAEEFTWEPTIGISVVSRMLMVDIRDLVSLEDVMEELDLGPNGGLVYCFEYIPCPPSSPVETYRFITPRSFKQYPYI